MARRIKAGRQPAKERAKPGKPEVRKYSRKQSLQTGAILVLLLYAIPAIALFIPYYNWEYLRSPRYAELGAAGHLRATARAFAWPYFAFFAPSDAPAQAVAMTDQRIADIKSSFIARLTSQCLASFAASEPWTAKIPVGRETFCPCFASGLFDVSSADKDSQLVAASQDTQTRAALIGVQCSREPR